ncbi:MAG: M15 family metallopeptidase [Clostridia bacterium]|nr:M15 family metallopeptidase [Clostridia bacterium]
MNNQNHSAIPAREQRERRKTQILMAICLVFGLLVLTFVTLLITNIVNAIADRTPDEPDTPPVEQPDDIPDEPELPEEPQEPEVPLFTTLPCSTAAIHEGPLVLVNASHVYTFPANNGHMVNIYQELINSQTYSKYFSPVSAQLLMDRTAYQAMNKMLTAFSEQSGLGNAIVVADAYRSYEQQAAKNSSTKAGYSDHHTGLLCTLNVNGGNEVKNVAPYDWIYQNCHKYGFIVRYPADKASVTGVSNYEECFRYVGAAHAYAMKTGNLCLEEYLTSLRAYTKDAPLSVTTEDNATYEIYYVAAVGTETAVPVPTDATYTVSGDNEGGFIVTVKRS